MLRFQAQRHYEKHGRSEFQFRKNGRVSDEHGRDATRSGKQHAAGGHEKKMAEFSGKRSGQIKIKKMPLAKNRLEIASQNKENEHVSKQMPRPVMQKRGDDKLPGVGVAHAVVAYSKIIATETRPICFEEKLRYENRYVEPEQCEQDKARLLGPAPGEGELLSPG